MDIILQDLTKRVNALEAEEFNMNSKDKEKFEELMQAHGKLQQDYQWLLTENAKLRGYTKVLERDHKMLQKKYSALEQNIFALEQENKDLLDTHAQRKGQLGTLQRGKDQQHAIILQLKTTNKELENRNLALFRENEALKNDIEKYRKTKGFLSWLRRVCGVNN